MLWHRVQVFRILLFINQSHLNTSLGHEQITIIITPILDSMTWRNKHSFVDKLDLTGTNFLVNFVKVYIIVVGIKAAIAER